MKTIMRVAGIVALALTAGTAANASDLFALKGYQNTFEFSALTDKTDAGKSKAGAQVGFTSFGLNGQLDFDAVYDRDSDDTGVNGTLHIGPEMPIGFYVGKLDDDFKKVAHYGLEGRYSFDDKIEVEGYVGALKDDADVAAYDATNFGADVKYAVSDKITAGAKFDLLDAKNAGVFDDELQGSYGIYGEYKVAEPATVYAGLSNDKLAGEDEAVLSVGFKVGFNDGKAFWGKRGLGHVFSGK